MISDQAAVLEAIEAEPGSRPEDIADDLGWSVERVDAALVALLDAGLVMLGERGLRVAAASVRRAPEAVEAHRATVDTAGGAKAPCRPLCGADGERVSLFGLSLVAAEQEQEIGAWLDAQGR